MSMDMGMEMSPEMAIAQLQEDVAQIGDDLHELQKFVKGNGDPTKGLLWLAADLSRLLTTQSQLAEEHRKQSQERWDSHEREGHYDRRKTSALERMAWTVAERVLTILVTVLLILIWLGFENRPLP